MIRSSRPDFRTGMTMAVMLLVITSPRAGELAVLGSVTTGPVCGARLLARPMPLGRLRWVAFGFVVVFFVVTVVCPR